MPSSPTSRNRFEKQGLGENLNTWGTRLNLSGLDLIDAALDGVTTISATGAVTLSSRNYLADDSRPRILNFTGTSPVTATIPSVEKWYIVRAASDVTITTGAVVSATIKAGNIGIVFCDGTAVRVVQNPEFGGARLTGVGTPTAATDAATKAYVDLVRAYVDLTAWATVQGILPGQAGNAGEFLQTDGINPSWQPVYPDQTGNGGKTLKTDGSATAWDYAVQPVKIITSAYLAKAGERLGCDTTAGGFVVTLPVNPGPNDEDIVLFDAGATDTFGGWAVNPITINPGLKSIGGVVDTRTCSTKGASLTCRYPNSDWSIRNG